MIVLALVFFLLHVQIIVNFSGNVQGQIGNSSHYFRGESQNYSAISGKDGKHSINATRARTCLVNKKVKMYKLNPDEKGIRRPRTTSKSITTYQVCSPDQPHCCENGCCNYEKSSMYFLQMGMFATAMIVVVGCFLLKHYITENMKKPAPPRGLVIIPKPAPGLPQSYFDLINANSASSNSLSSQRTALPIAALENITAETISPEAITVSVKMAGPPTESHSTPTIVSKNMPVD